MITLVLKSWNIATVTSVPLAILGRLSNVCSNRLWSSPSDYWGIVHRTVQMEMHYAAMVKPPTSPENTVTSGHFPAFYTKYVVDELLYRFPEAANMTNGDAKFPLELAISTGKQWIGGGNQEFVWRVPALRVNDFDLFKQKINNERRQWRGIVSTIMTWIATWETLWGKLVTNNSSRWRIFFLLV